MTSDLVLAHGPERKSTQAQCRYQRRSRFHGLSLIFARSGFVAIVHHDDIARMYAPENAADGRACGTWASPVEVPEHPAPANQCVVDLPNRRIHLTATPAGVRPKRPTRPRPR